MRVAIVAECFLPAVNGVTRSVMRVAEQLERRGAQVLLVAPGIGPSAHGSAEVVRVPGVRLPMYPSLSVGLPTAQVERALRSFRPDVVHLAAPAVLGAAGADAARAIGVPSVAVYQTDFAGFARRYGYGLASPLIWDGLRRVHNRADLTLAPSTLACWQLQHHGIGPVALWGRGVDTDSFHPRHRSPALHRQLAPNGELIVGYVGRLAPEKQVGLLGHASGLAGCHTVVAGDGPALGPLRRRLPSATFVGFQSGAALSRLFATLDVFVHTGPDETFCQAVQEALASGVPVVAPAAGGPVDLVAHGTTGWLYPASRPALLRGAVACLAADPDLRRTMGGAARRSVEGRTWPAVVDALVGHYRSVIEGRPARPPARAAGKRAA